MTFGANLFLAKIINGPPIIAWGRLQNASIKQQKAAAAAAAVAAAAAEVQCGRNPQHPKAHLPAAGDERGGPTGDGANRVRRRTRARGGPVNSAMRVN